MKILVVDDNNETLRIYLRALLRKLSSLNIGTQFMQGENLAIEVDDADSVSLALKKLKAQHFNILIVDLKIPGLAGEEMGGLWLIEESMRLDPLRPVIAITGYGTKELIKRTFALRVFDFIEKSSTAVDDLIKSVQVAIDHSNEKVIRSGNPFTPMTGIEPTVFGGRNKELEFFEQRLNRAMHKNVAEHFLVLGNWGIGKSTLLKEYKKICQSRGHLASIVPLEALQTGTALIDAANSLVEGILRDLPYPVAQFKKLVEFFDSIGISVLGTGFNLKRDSSKKALSPQAFLHDVLTKLWQDLEKKTGVFVIMIDDLDNFMAAPEILMTLRQTLSMDSIRNTKILVGIASTPNYWLELTSINTHHPIARYFLTRVELDPLSEEELTETIINSLSGTAVSFDSEVIGKVFEYTRGHPFEMQVLCSHLFSNQLSRKVTVDVWDKSLQSTLNDLGVAIFNTWYNQASGEEAKILQVIANTDSPIFIKELHKIATENQVKISLGNISKYLQRLTEKKLVIKTGRGLYTLLDPMFRAYIRTRDNAK